MKKRLSTIALGLLLTSIGWAQTADISGLVTDPTGAIITRANVKIMNQATGVSRETTTSKAGVYSVPNLSPGVYDIDVVATGFKKQIQEGVKLEGATRARLDFSLQVGAVEDTVTVVASSVTEEGAATGTTLDNRRLVELPINGRDYSRFGLLAPGGTARTGILYDVTFNGLGTQQNSFSIDGVDASAGYRNSLVNGYERGARLLTASLDTIEEFRVQSSNYAPEFGRSAGSNISFITKSGTNNVHGTLYEFFRNSALDARNFFAPASKPPFRFNDFGANLAGPIAKDKTFYFLNYEGAQQRIGLVGSGTVPSTSLKNQVIATSPELQPIVKLYLPGTEPTADSRVDRISTSQSLGVEENTGSVKVDHHFSESDSAFVRVNLNDSQVRGPIYNVVPTALSTVNFQNAKVRTVNVALHEQHIFNPSLVGEILVGTQRIDSPLLQDTGYPQITVGGFTGTPGGIGNVFLQPATYQVTGSVSALKGSHSLKWGTGAYFRSAKRSTTGSEVVTYPSIDAFIKNEVATATITPALPERTPTANQIGFFFQDSYKMFRRITVDYGLRWDYQTVVREKHNQTVTYDTRTGATGFPGQPFYRPAYNDWGPRLGIAWQIAPKTVLRAGYGIFWSFLNYGYLDNALANLIPDNTTLIRQNIPNLSYPITPFLSQGTTPPPNIFGFDWNHRDIYAQQWNFALSRELSRQTSLQVAYVGNRGLNLDRLLPLNLFDPSLGRRPNPNFNAVTVWANNGQSSYNSMQVSLNRRLGNGLVFSVEYRYSHVIDDVDDITMSTSPQDSNNLKAERGNGSNDIRHHFTYSVVYSVPVGAGHRVLGGQSLASRLVGGWSIASVSLMRTGVPLSVVLPTNTSGNGNFVNQRPNLVPGVSPYAAHKSVNGWLNPAAFALPAPGTFGNLGRNTVYGPGLTNLDVSLLKDTRLGETTSLQFRAEVFNVLNHPAFAQPNGTFGTGNFGMIFNTLGTTIGLGTSRQIQLALKLKF